MDPSEDISSSVSCVVATSLELVTVTPSALIDVVNTVVETRRLNKPIFLDILYTILFIKNQ